jgi:UDP-N-acetylglucosamine/UDP-N-acetyl-alpha-D-glucosaminouronate 4-epimerase
LEFVLSNYLVTGGAGFIGSNLVAEMLAQGHSVRTLDNYSTGKRHNLTPAANLEIIEGDVTRIEDVRRAARDVEVIFHQAAVPSVPKSIEDPLGSNRATVDGTLNVLVAAREMGVRRVIFASSSAIYGDQDPTLAKVETMTPQPISPYGVAKLAAESYCRVFYGVYGLETVALRYFNVFGPRQDPMSMYAAVIPRFITAMLANKPPTIYGDGEQTRDFTYVGNVVQGNLLAANAPIEKVGGQVINLAAGGQTSLSSLVDMLVEVMGNNIEPIYADVRGGDIKHSRADISRARLLMGFEPSTTLLEGLRRTIDWYRDKHDGNQ